MEDLVENVLKAAAEKEAAYKSTDVTKAIDVELDVGNLLACDNNPLEETQFRANRESFLKALARDNTQLLINKIWELPIQRVEEAIIAELPDTTTVLPREKPIPKEKATTKWQAYANLKGIQNKKRGRMVWDDEAKEWKPRWGYNKAGDESKQWVIEVPENADPNEDQFAKINKAKKERVAKNELQRLRNIGRTMKGKVPGVGLTPTVAPDKDHVTRQLSAARNSDASIGKFSRDLPKEKPMKNSGKRRKYEANTGNLKAEKQRAMNILKRVNSGKGVLDSKKLNQPSAKEDNKKGKKYGGKGKAKPERNMKGKGKGKAGAKPAGGGKKGGKKR